MAYLEKHHSASRFLFFATEPYLITPHFSKEFNHLYNDNALLL